MSSRLIAPNDGAIAVTAATISSGSVVLSTIGTESSPANAFISADLPSITGSDAFGPMSPRPSTAVPSEMTATTRDAQVYSRAAAGSRAIRLDTPATPGVYSIDRSRRSASGARSSIDSLPAAVGGEHVVGGEAGRRGLRCSSGQGRVRTVEGAEHGRSPARTSRRHPVDTDGCGMSGTGQASARWALPTAGPYGPDRSIGV